MGTICSSFLHIAHSLRVVLTFASCNNGGQTAASSIIGQARLWLGLSQRLDGSHFVTRMGPRHDSHQPAAYYAGFSQESVATMRFSVVECTSQLSTHTTGAGINFLAGRSDFLSRPFCQSSRTRGSRPRR